MAAETLGFGSGGGLGDGRHRLVSWAVGGVAKAACWVMVREAEVVDAG